MYVASVLVLFTLASTAFTVTVAQILSSVDSAIAISSSFTSGSTAISTSSASAPLATPSDVTSCVVQCITQLAKSLNGCDNFSDLDCVCPEPTLHTDALSCVRTNCADSDSAATALLSQECAPIASSITSAARASSVSSVALTSLSSSVLVFSTSLVTTGAFSKVTGPTTAASPAPAASFVASTFAASTGTNISGPNATKQPNAHSSTPSKSFKSSKTAIAAGTTVAGIVTVVAICCLILLIARRKRARLGSRIATPQQGAVQPYTVAPPEAEGQTRLKITVADLEQANGPPPEYCSDSGSRASSDELLPPYVSGDGGSRLFDMKSGA